MKYYEFDLANFPNCSYIFLFGGRSSGKSTSVAKYLKDKYDADKSEFVRVFRNYTAMRSATTWFSLFNDETTDIVFDRQKYLYNGMPFLRPHIFYRLDESQHRGIHLFSEMVCRRHHRIHSYRKNEHGRDTQIFACNPDNARAHVAYC